jgi:phage terminase small subunit
MGKPKANDQPKLDGKPAVKTKTSAKTSGKASNVKPDAGEPKPLTLKQRVFIAEYAKDCNGTQAAIRAGYSPATANEQAARLLANVSIRSQANEAVAKACEKVELTVERTLREVARLAFFDARKLLNEDGSPKQLSEIDDDTAASIAGVELLEEYEGSGENRKLVGYVKKFKIADKNAALEKAMKHLALYEKHNAQIADPIAKLFAQVVNTPLRPAGESADE